MLLALPGFFEAAVFDGEESGHRGGPYTTKLLPGTWLHPEVYRRIIPEASAEDNRRFVRYAKGKPGIWLAVRKLIELYLQGNDIGGALGSVSTSMYTVNLTKNPPPIEMTGSPFPANNRQQLLFHPSGRLMYSINYSSRVIINFVDSFSGSINEATTRFPATAGGGGVNVGVIDQLGHSP